MMWVASMPNCCGRAAKTLITQAQMGHALGLTEDIVSKFERLKRPLPLEVSIVWARLTGLDLKDYFEELQFLLRKIYSPKP